MVRDRCPAFTRVDVKRFDEEDPAAGWRTFLKSRVVYFRGEFLSSPRMR
jgi:hypothetical protein